MHRIWVAFRAFFLALFHADAARRIDEVLQQRCAAIPAPSAPQVAAQKSPPAKAPEKPKPAPRAPVRSEALTLLAALQREARFVDFVKEPLGDYSDAQIGAVARDVHRDCSAVLERMFALRAASDAVEGADIEVPAGFDAGRYRLVGNVAGEPPFRGHLAHHGWEATVCQLPAWSGSDESARIIAPVEVELK